jgi:hypothetical protein
MLISKKYLLWSKVPHLILALSSKLQLLAKNKKCKEDDQDKKVR